MGVCGLKMLHCTLQLDSTELNQALALFFCLNMTFPENRLPVFRIMLEQSEAAYSPALGAQPSLILGRRHAKIAIANERSPYVR
jgi:hypothetical protein